MHRARAGRAGHLGRSLVAAALAAPTATLVACGPESVDRSSSAPPRRIVSLMPQVTELIVALGEGHRLVGRISGERDPALALLPDVGDPVDPSLEAVLGLRPDLVVAWAEGHSADDFRALIGPDALWLTRSETLADLWANLSELGTRLARERGADSLARALESGLDSVRALRPSRGSRTRVFFVVWEDPLVTAGPGSFPHELIEIAGGHNVFEDSPTPWPRVSLESVVHRDPDGILWPRRDGAPLSLADRGGWRFVPAAADGRVAVLDPDVFERPGVKVVEAARRLARAFRRFAPRRFTPMDTLVPTLEEPR